MEVARSRARVVWIGVAAVALVAGIGIVAVRYFTRPYRPGTTVDQMLSCSALECKIEVAGSDATKPAYLWTTDSRFGGVADVCDMVAQPIPEAWSNQQVSGELHIHRDWSKSPHPAATFTSGDNSLELFGGDTTHAKFLYVNVDIAGGGRTPDCDP